MSGEDITTLYTELNKNIHKSDYKQVLKTCNKIIHSKDGKDEIEAMVCKVVCFIQMNHFTEALKFISSTPEVQQHSLFEKAYCQYRLLKSEEALETINEMETLDLRTLELKGQILYKLNRYSECYVIYKKLVKECSDDQEDERLTNLSAVNGALSMFEGVETRASFQPQTHEQFYNAGCVKLGEKKFEEAKKMLEEAERVCRKSLAEDEDITEEEIESEVCIIRVQLAYVLQMLGRYEEAISIYHQVVRSRPADVALLAVASNNIITINKDQNLFDSRKRLKATAGIGIENKLVLKQRKQIDINRALLLMSSNQWPSCKQQLKVMKEKYPDDENVYLIQAAMICKEKGKEDAIEFLKNHLDKYSDHDGLIELKLPLAQLLLQQGKVEEAYAIFRTIENVCYSPSIVSLLVSLLNQNNIEMIDELFERAIEWNKLKKNKPVLSVLMWKAALYHSKNNRQEKAAQILEEMLSFDPDNVKIMAQLIFTYSNVNEDKAHQMSERLSSLSDLALDVDVDELEANASGSRYIKRQQKTENTNKIPTSVSERSGEVIKKKKKKKKNNPKPKDFVEGYVPDPERWIPLRDRSTYKGKRRDKRKAQMKGSQGLSTSTVDKYDMSQKKPTQPAVPTADTNSPKPTQTRPQPSKNKKNAKRKKKGKGW